MHLSLSTGLTACSSPVSVYDFATVADADASPLNVTPDNEDQLAEAVKMSDEEIATDRRKNEGGHTELSQHRNFQFKKRFSIS